MIGSMNPSKEEKFMKKHFEEYYKKNRVSSVSEIGKREFGYGVFGKKIANRNLAISTEKEMNSFLSEQVPLFFSYSNAYYNFPDKQPMAAKELLRADIVYEFDADDIPTNCKERHDSWVCPNSHSGKGNIEECPECGERTTIDQWFCSECLGEAKKQVFKLLKILEDDLGFSEGIEINFSGKAGYHIRLNSERIQRLGRNARIELVDYLTASGMYFEKLGYGLSGKTLTCPKKPVGWQKRINEGTKQMFNEDPVRIAAHTNFPLKKVKKLFELKEEAIKAMGRGVLFPPEGRKGKEFWKSLLELVKEKEALPIDRQTSVDLHKIMRVPDTLHGETGLCAQRTPIGSLKKFDPFKGPVVFGNEPVKVFINKAPKFFLKGRKFGPFEKEEVELPLFCAVYLVGKGAVLK